VFTIDRQVFGEGLKNGDDVLVQKLDNMPAVRDILIMRRGNAELVSKGEYVFPNKVIRSWDNLLKRIGIENCR